MRLKEQSTRRTSYSEGWPHGAVRLYRNRGTVKPRLGLLVSGENLGKSNCSKCKHLKGLSTTRFVSQCLLSGKNMFSGLRSKMAHFPNFLIHVVITG